MKATKILTEEIDELKISSLPTRPTSKIGMGGVGYSAKEMKAAFDALPLFIIERFNALISDISDIGEDSLVGALPTGLLEGHTVKDFFEDVKSGNLASYLTVGTKTLSSEIYELRERVKVLEEELLK